VAQRTLVQRQALLDLSEQRTRAGLDSQVELTQAQAGMPDARTQIEMLASRSRWRAARLPCSAPRRPMRMRSRPAVGAAHAGRAQVLGADLLGRRPDVVAARWRVEAATQGIESPGPTSTPM
jgi:outer membrane protein TolC